MSRVWGKKKKKTCSEISQPCFFFFSPPPPQLLEMKRAELLAVSHRSDPQRV